MKTLLENAVSEGFVDLGFAEWVPGKGLQINNLDRLDTEAPGIYIMHYKGHIHKVGKSSASLLNRLNGYKGFDRSKTDKSAEKQRLAIEKWDLPGMNVMVLQPKVTVTEFSMLGVETKAWSFDAHSLEKKIIKLAKDENHKLDFGS